MLYHILAIGDVVGEPGLRHLEKVLPPLRKLKGAAFTVVNGENASGVGLTREQAQRIRDAGADAVTLGNHSFGRPQIGSFLDDVPWLLRPANYSGRAPGHGCEIFDLGAVRIRVMNLIGRCGLAWGADNPFTTADRLLEQGEADFTLVDFHAEATSEKLALGYYLDGRVSALWGTHTHVPTADNRVYPKGTGYLTDDRGRGVRPGHRALAIGGELPGGPPGALPAAGGALQDGGGGVHPGQRHRPLHGGGAAGYPLEGLLQEHTKRGTSSCLSKK